MQEIMSQFWPAYPEISRNTANENALMLWINQNAGSQVSLDSLNRAVEALGDSLSHQKLPDPILTEEQQLQVKLKARKMHERWLQSLSSDELKVQAKQEAAQVRAGRQPYQDLALSPDEKEQAKKLQPVVPSQVRLWADDSHVREYNRAELLKLSASQIRRMLWPNSQRDPKRDAERRYNQIIANEVQPEGN
jgi:hypothetical protein